MVGQHEGTKLTFMILMGLVAAMGVGSGICEGSRWLYVRIHNPVTKYHSIRNAVHRTVQIYVAGLGLSGLINVCTRLLTKVLSLASDWQPCGSAFLFFLYSAHICTIAFNVLQTTTVYSNVNDTNLSHSICDLPLTQKEDIPLVSVRCNTLRSILEVMLLIKFPMFQLVFNKVATYTFFPGVFSDVEVRHSCFSRR